MVCFKWGAARGKILSMLKVQSTHQENILLIRIYDFPCFGAMANAFHQKWHVASSILDISLFKKKREKKGGRWHANLLSQTPQKWELCALDIQPYSYWIYSSHALMLRRISCSFSKINDLSFLFVCRVEFLRIENGIFKIIDFLSCVVVF